MAASRKPRAGACELAVRRDLAKLPKDLADGGIAASVLVMAQGLDAKRATECPHCGGDVPVTANSLTAMSNAQARLQEALTALRALAPPAEKQEDRQDDLIGRRAARLARRATPES
jgi:hypothetical protein